MKVVTAVEIDVEQLMQSIRDELAGRRTRRTEPSRAHRQSPVDPVRLFLPDPVSPPAQTPLQAQEGNSHRLQDFLQYESAEFVRTAYQRILLREADSGGLNCYLGVLRQGASKVEILGRIRYSPEGRRRGTKVYGLTAPFILDWILRLPIVGHILGMAVAIWNGPLTERRLRRLSTEFAYWRAQSEQDSLRTTQHIHEALRILEQSQNRTVADVNDVKQVLLEAVQAGTEHRVS